MVRGIFGIVYWVLFGESCRGAWCVARPAPRCETNQCAEHCDRHCRCGRVLSEDEKAVVAEMRRFIQQKGKN